MVLRTYTTGLSMTHYPREERKGKRHKFADIIEELSDENLKHCRKFSKEIVNYLLDKDFENLLISDPLPKIKINKGKFGVNELMEHIGIANNHLHSSYHLMANSAKGLFDRISKFQEFLEWFKTHKLELLKWILFRRSTYLIHTFQKKWGLSFHYLDPLMRGIHNHYYGDTLPCYLKEITFKEFMAGLIAEIARIESQEEITEGTKSFLRSLYYLQKKLEGDPEIIISDLAFIPTGWKNLKLWVENLGLTKYGLNRWASVFRSIFSQVYLSDYERMINKLYTAKVQEFFKIPFTEFDKEKNNFREKKLPYLMVSGPKYVIRRENNAKSLEMMRSKGYFYLRFKFQRERWKESIELRVKPSRKMRQFINKDIKLMTMIILSPRGPARDVDIQLIFEGKEEVFIGTKHLDKPLKLKLELEETEVIAIDINRRGKYALVTNLGLALSEEITQINDRWSTALEGIEKYQSLIDTSPEGWKRDNHKNLLSELHHRKENLRRTYHQKLANWLGRHLVGSKTRTLLMEDLNCHTYGTKKALAKAIESMADEISLYAREVYAVKLHTGRNCELVTQSAYNTSTIHVNCGGKLERDEDNYDIAPCLKCSKMVNTHVNSVLYQINQYKFTSVHSPEANF